MNRQTFLDDLERRLKGLPQAERQYALAYYNEYLDDAEPADEAGEVAVLDALGTPAEVAATIIADYAGGKGGGLSTVWIVLLGVLASPIALPLALAAVIVIVALLFTVLAVAVSLLISAVVLVVIGLVAAAVGCSFALTHFATTLFYVGAGFVAMALGLALGLATLWLGRVCIRGIVFLGAKILRRRGVQS